jgi:hypothetical protein
MKIFLDVDGVFADFNKRLSEILTIGDNRHSTKIWSPISREYRFFWHLELIPDSLRLIHVLEKAGHDLEFLTALPLPSGGLVTADEDKREWLNYHVSKTIPVNTIIGGKNKPLWLKKHPGAVLIDDTHRNIELWNAAGGVGILHEQGNVDGTLSYLTALRII